MDIASVAVYTRIKVAVNGSFFEGLLLPTEGKTVVLKLDSGYNVGLLPDSISDVEVLQSPVKPASPVSLVDLATDTSLPTVKIMHTGGTIASRVDYATGGVIADFSPESLIALFPELAEIADIKSEFMGNMFSDDFRFSHFNKIAKSILRSAREGGVRKFIVTSGTDFLHYLSAALSFLLKDVPVGVLVVGAQRSSDRGSSDAGVNLVCAAQFLATVKEFTGVATCMHASSSDDACLLVSGTQVRKLHASRRDAFKPVNKGPLARIDFSSRKVELFSDIPVLDVPLPDSLPLFREDIRVGLCYSHPQFFAKELDVYDDFDGVVLAGSGLGQFPISSPDGSAPEHEVVFDRLCALAKRMPVVMATQAIFGRVHMNVYAPARKLLQAGVLGHGSLMPVETAFVKLAWLLSNYSDDEVRDLFMRDIVGELNSGESNRFFGGEE